jgi:hypothetical protein
LEQKSDNQSIKSFGLCYEFEIVVESHMDKTQVQSIQHQIFEYLVHDEQESQNPRLPAVPLPAVSNVDPTALPNFLSNTQGIGHQQSQKLIVSTIQESKADCDVKVSCRCYKGEGVDQKKIFKRSWWEARALP